MEPDEWQEYSPARRVALKRTALGLSQAQLAEKINTSQPVISAIESGARALTPKMEQRLFAALQERPSQTLKRHHEKVLEILRQAKIENARVFGSVARGEDTVESDIDFLIGPEISIGLLGITSLILQLQDLLGVSVDIVMESSRNRGKLQDALRDAVELESFG